MANELARHFRSNPTFTEKKAWKALRGLRKLHGVHVRRQHPIGRYIVDFAVQRDGLAIELDGGAHEVFEAPEARQRRDQAIQAAGWRVLHLPAQVALDEDKLVESVLEALGLDS